MAKRKRLAHIRKTAGYTQEQFAHALGVERSTVTRWEAGDHEPLPYIRPKMAGKLGITADELIELLAPPYETVAYQPDKHQRTEVDVDRRTFNGMVGGVLTGAAFPAITLPTRVGAADVQRLRAALDWLRNADHQIGGTALLHEALKLFTQAKSVLDGADYSEETGRQLMAVTAELGITSGWCAYDSSNQPLARHVYNEAALLAESIGDPELIVHVYTNMAQQAAYLAWGGNRGLAREAIRFIQRAADAVRHHPSPRLHALVSLREAMSHSPMGDETALRAATTRARRALDRSAHPADPTWTQFVTDSEITGQEGIFYRIHGNPDRAVGLFHRVLDDTERSPRDRVYYRANLATGLWDSGEHNQAIAEGTALLPEGHMTVRTLNQLQPIRAGVGAAADEFCHRYDAAVASLTAK